MRSVWNTGACRVTALIVAGFAFTLSVSSCDDDGGPRMKAADYNEAGWESYGLGDYASAHSSFVSALSMDGDLVEARLGLGWCEAWEGEHEAALESFDTVIETGEFVGDAYAARAAAALAASMDSLAVASAESTLVMDADYVFARRDGYDWRDLRLILAQARFAMAQYADAQEQVDILDPGNGLDPGDPASWVVDEVAHPTYEAALAMEIERLWAVQGGAL